MPMPTARFPLQCRSPHRDRSRWRYLLQRGWPECHVALSPPVETEVHVQDGTPFDDHRGVPRQRLPRSTAAPPKIVLTIPVVPRTNVYVSHCMRTSPSSKGPVTTDQTAISSTAPVRTKQIAPMRLSASPMVAITSPSSQVASIPGLLHELVRRDPGSVWDRLRQFLCPSGAHDQGAAYADERVDLIADLMFWHADAFIDRLERLVEECPDLELNVATTYVGGVPASPGPERFYLLQESLASALEARGQLRRG